MLLIRQSDILNNNNGWILCSVSIDDEAAALMVLSEPPQPDDQQQQQDLIRRAISASAVLMNKPSTSNVETTAASTDVLSGFGSSKESSPSLEDALSLDDDISSDGGAPPSTKKHRKPVQPQPSSEGLFAAAKGFLLPRSPARLFVHNSVVQSALLQVANTSSSESSEIVHHQEMINTVVEVMAQHPEIPESTSSITEITEDVQDNTNNSSVILDELKEDPLVIPEVVTTGESVLVVNSSSESSGIVHREEISSVVEVIPQEPELIQSEEMDNINSTIPETSEKKEDPVVVQPDEQQQQYHVKQQHQDSGVCDRMHPTADETSADLVSSDEYQTPVSGGESSISNGYHTPSNPLPLASGESY